MTVGDGGSLEPGTYVTADPFPARVTFTVPAGWEGQMGGPYFVHLNPASAPDALWFQVFDDVYAHPCQNDGVLLDPLPGASVDDLANALASLPGLEVTTPTDVSLGGHEGKQLTVSAPATGATCRVWALPLGATNEMAPGDQQRVWILDVDGQRLVIDAPEPPGLSADSKAEALAIVDSIHIEPVAAAAETTHLSLVGLGDSIPGALNCPPGCRSYVEVYGDLASQALQVPVRVLNLATNDRLDSTQLLSRVRDDHTHRTALAAADLITVTIGNNDQSGFWGCTSDEACSTARAQTAQNIAAILHEIAVLRAGRPTAIRVTDYYDMAVGDQPLATAKLAAFNAMICQVAEANGAVCVDLVPAFNGPDGSADAGDLLLGDHIHASEAGQDLIAKTIDATGYAPLHASGLPQGSANPSPVPSAATQEGAYVAGTFTSNRGARDFAGDITTAWGRQQRGRSYSGYLEMDDARLSGDVTATDNADRYCDGECGPDTFRADILWGTIEITNDGGTWTGTSVGSSQTYYQLAGTGTYQGLSAILFETELPSGEVKWAGTIVPGALPPDRSSSAGASARGSGSPSPAPSSPAAVAALVTGSLVSTRGDAEFDEDTATDYGQRQRGRAYTGSVTMDDARLTGDLTGTDNADRYFGPNTDGTTAEILWGALKIRNHAGTWSGTSVGTSDKTAGGRGVTFYQLVGKGDYEGLSAIVFETEVPAGDPVWSGVIFPGELPPAAR